MDIDIFNDYSVNKNYVKKSHNQTSKFPGPDKMSFQTITTEIDNNVGIITFNRPKVLNALSTEVRNELHIAFNDMSEDEAIGAIILTGGEKAFAAGADIKEMQDNSYMDMYLGDNSAKLQNVLNQCKKPVIAAVSGYALGGGCELAMICDFIIASESAKFGQPEITIGALPGWGGTQRLTRLVGKSKAMDMCLTGRMMNAEEAERSGLASRVLPQENFIEEVKKIAQQIASYSRPATAMNKECVNHALETNLQAGLLYERRQFQAVFATDDQKEGMAAFVEKRSPNWSNK